MPDRRDPVSLRSRLLGRLPLEESMLEPELARIREFPMQMAYSDFAIGSWSSCVLANEHGDPRRAVIYGYEGRWSLTPNGQELPYLWEVLEHSLDLDKLRWARLFVARRGLLVPHRDYLELPAGFARINVMLCSDPTCMHSEEDMVFRMRPGEVWNLDVDRVHSGCSLGDFQRILLVLDFAVGEGSVDDLVRMPRGDDGVAYDIVERPPLSMQQLESLYALSTIVEGVNIGDILQLLTKVHFYRDVSARACHDWLIEIALRSGNGELHRKAIDFRRFCTEARSLNETFTW